LSGRRNTKVPIGGIFPAHTITYSSIITILLSLCIMLVPIGKIQNHPAPEKQTSSGFIWHTALGSVFANSLANISANKGDRYPTADTEGAIRLNTIKAREQELGKMFECIGRQMKTIKSPLKAQAVNFSAMDIEFAQGQSELDDMARNYLKHYAENIQQTRSAGRIKLYIAAAASDVNDRKQQYILSAQRAHQVEAFLKSLLPAGFNCPIYSSGVGAKSSSTQGSQAMAAVLQSERD
jgi:hypothetical protein